VAACLAREDGGLLSLHNGNEEVPWSGSGRGSGSSAGDKNAHRERHDAKKKLHLWATGNPLDENKNKVGKLDGRCCLDVLMKTRIQTGRQDNPPPL
jgi:hypothetical protein